MPANLKDLRRRIKSVKSTQQITKAMKMVSAAKFGRAQASALHARHYAVELSRLIKHLAYFVRGGCSLPLFNQSPSNNALMVIISSERGLCGGYNSNIIKQANKTQDLLKTEGFNVFLTCIGKKAFQSLLRKKQFEFKSSAIMSPNNITEDIYSQNPDTILNANALTLITTPFEKDVSQSVESLSEAISTLYAQQKIGKFVIVYSKFQSALIQTPLSETILPFNPNHPLQTDGHIKESESFIPEPIFEPERDELLAMALPRYMRSQIYHSLLEAYASEHGARMTAMDNATRNSKEMEKKLQITYQRARQAAITNELIEIISGAEAL